MPVPRTEIAVHYRGDLLFHRVLTPGQYILGSESSQLRLAHPGLLPQHALLSIESHVLTVEDLGSVGGLFIGQRRVSGPTRLFPNEVVTLSPGLELSATRVRDDEDDPEASCSIQQAYVDRLLPPEFRQALKYDVQLEAGRGGMGTVFRVHEMSIRRQVAMKVMRAQTSEEAIARFIGEAQITGQLEHPNIVPVHELGVDEHDQLFYTMKYVRGDTLKALLGRMAAGDADTVRKFPLPQLLFIFEKVCDAVAFAHSRRVIHRDLKPENVMLGEFGEVLVMDWGLAVLLPDTEGAIDAHGAGNPIVRVAAPPPPSDPLRRAPDHFAGTPQFMAPEQARGEAASVDVAADIYALGAILFNILFLETPIQGGSVKEVLENVRAGRTRLEGATPSQRPLPHCGSQGPPVSLVAVARKAMAPLPGDRYPSVKELQVEIRSYFAGFATRAEQAGVGRQLLLLLGRYKREALWLGACALILAVFGTLAGSALADLRASAPAFVRQADMLARQQNFTEALDKLEYALRLQPNSPEAYLLKGDVLQASLRLEEAAVAYRKARSLDPAPSRAEANAELCERVAAKKRPDGTFPLEDLGLLYRSMAAESRPLALLSRIAELIDRNNESIRQYWLEHLRESFPIRGGKPLESRLPQAVDGQLTLDLSDTAVADLSPLAGMPLVELNLSNCARIHDLGSLKGLKLESLKLDRTSVTDLAPLKGMELENLSIVGTPVMDLSALDGSPLRSLDCADTSITDFSALTHTRLIESLTLPPTVTDLGFLSGLPVRELRLDKCIKAEGYSALLGLRALEVLSLRDDFHELPAKELPYISNLKTLPLLRQIVAGGGKDETSEAFWTKWEADLRWLAIVRKTAGCSAQFLDGGLWKVALNTPSVKDLEFVRGGHIVELNLYETPVSDIGPLAGMPLEALDLRRTKVTDISPLRSLGNLRELKFWQNSIKDFSPLSSLQQLEFLDLTETPFSDLSLLKTDRLRVLRIGHTKVTDLTPLEKMPLETLHCDTVEVISLKPLLACKELRRLIAPARRDDIVILRKHPALERLSYHWTDESFPIQSVAEFWAEWDAQNLAPQ